MDSAGLVVMVKMRLDEVQVAFPSKIVKSAAPGPIGLARFGGPLQAADAARDGPFHHCPDDVSLAKDFLGHAMLPMTICMSFTSALTVPPVSTGAGLRTCGTRQQHRKGPSRIFAEHVA